MNRNITLDLELLSEYRRWKQSWGEHNLTLWDYIRYRGDIELAAAFSKLFWPDFIEIDGCILLAQRYDPNTFQEWKNALKGDCRSIELTINHVHLYDLFGETQRDVDDQRIFEYVGAVLLKCWSCALHKAFPDKRFKLYYQTDPLDYGPTLSFCQDG